jgi:hypothetical protein
MVQSRASEAGSRSGDQEILSYFGNPKVHYRVHKTLSFIKSVEQNPSW